MDNYELELSQEEYDAIMEAREYMEEKSNFDKYLNSNLNKSKEAFRKYQAYKDIADSSSSPSARKKAKEKAYQYYDDHHKYDNINGSSTREIKKYHNRSKRGENIGRTGAEIRDARDAYKALHGDVGERPEERYKANRYLNAQNAIRGKKAVKEAVLDWYDENGIEIDDYELGRIDSFVENYIEENF